MYFHPEYARTIRSHMSPQGKVLFDDVADVTSPNPFGENHRKATFKVVEQVLKTCVLPHIRWYEIGKLIGIWCFILQCSLMKDGERFPEKEWDEQDEFLKEVTNPHDPHDPRIRAVRDAVDCTRFNVMSRARQRIGFFLISVMELEKHERKSFSMAQRVANAFDHAVSA